MQVESAKAEIEADCHGTGDAVKLLQQAQTIPTTRALQSPKEDAESLNQDITPNATLSTELTLFARDERSDAEATLREDYGNISQEDYMSLVEISLLQKKLLRYADKILATTTSGRREIGAEYVSANLLAANDGPRDTSYSTSGKIALQQSHADLARDRKFRKQELELEARERAIRERELYLKEREPDPRIQELERLVRERELELKGRALQAQIREWDKAEEYRKEFGVEPPQTLTKR